MIQKTKEGDRMSNPVDDRKQFLEEAIEALEEGRLFRLIMQHYEGDLSSEIEGLTEEELEACATLGLSEFDPILRGRGV
jgi:hypothetical protein